MLEEKYWRVKEDCNLVLTLPLEPNEIEKAMERKAIAQYYLHEEAEAIETLESLFNIIPNCPKV